MNMQLVFQRGQKAIIYSTCTCVKYAGNTLTIRKTTIYKYSSNNGQLLGRPDARTATPAGFVGVALITIGAATVHAH
jgi:hypothetical protein